MQMKNILTIKKYEQNINNVINYITNNIGNNITLDELSKVACFSKYHFHRIFKSLTGENVFEFIRRLQLEKAAYMLACNPSKSITDIALDCGFSSSQNFSKLFKIGYLINPTEYRSSKKLHDKFSNHGNILSNIGKADNDNLHYNNIIENGSKSVFKINEFKDISDIVKVKNIPELHIALYKADWRICTGITLPVIYKYFIMGKGKKFNK